MSGECAHLPPHGQVIDRLRRRFTGLKQHSQERQSRLSATQNARTEAERGTTAMLLQRAQENKLKKQGKYKPDQMRSKSGEQSVDVRSNPSDNAINKMQLKRKLGSGNSAVCNNGALAKQSNLFNGFDSGMTSTGGMSNFINAQQHDFGNETGAEKNKKLKMDAEPQFVGSSSIPTSSGNVNNCNAISVQIVQFNNDQQQTIETTVNVNTSSKNSQGNSDSQSVSVNVAKDIKKEMGNQDANQGNQNTFGSDLNKQTNQSDQQQQQQQEQEEQQCENGLTEGFGFNENELETLLNELADGSITQSDLGFDMGQDVQQQNEQSISQEQGQQQQMQQQDSNPNNSDEQTKDGQFRCKTEKVDFLHFGSPNQQQQQQQFYSNNPPRSYGTPVDANERQSSSSPYNNQAANQQNMQQKMNMPPQQGSNTANANMTSQHIHRLSVSVNSQFNVPKDQQQQQQLQQQQHAPTSLQHQQQTMGMPNVNRTTPNNADSMRLTPDVPPRLSHLAPGMPKSMSPSSVSYSVIHQPHSDPNFQMSSGHQGQTSGSFYGNMSQSVHQTNAATAMGGVNNPSMPRSRMPMPNSSQGVNQNFSDAMHRSSWGMNVANSLANSNMSGMPISTSGMSKAQQLKELAEKSSRPGGMTAQWNANSSMNMSSVLSYNGASLTQQQQMSAEMQYTGFQSASPNVNGPTQPQSSMHHNKLSAANAAAQAAVVASNRQQSGAYATNRLSHFPIEDNYAGNSAQATMNAKQMYANRGFSSTQVQLQQAMKNRFLQRSNAQQMMRGVRPSSDISSGGASAVPGFYGRQVDPSFPQSAVSNNAMMNGSSGATNMRLHHPTAASTNQQRLLLAQRQRKMMEQYKINVAQKAVMPSGAALPQRGPSPLSRSAMSHPQQQTLSSHNLPGSSSSPRMQLNPNSGVMIQGGVQGGASMHTMGMQANGPMVSWNRNTHGQPQPVMSNAGKLPPYSNVNLNANPMVGGNGASSMGAMPHRSAMTGGMNIPGGNQIQSSGILNRGMGVRSSQTQMHSQRVGGYPQNQAMVPSSNMTNSNIMASSQVNQGFSTPNDILSGPNDVMNAYDQQAGPNSPNVELNLITDFLDGK